MTRLDPNDRHQIEAHLGRALTGEELVEVATLDALHREQLDVVSRLGSRGILAIAYVRAVVPSTDWSNARAFVIDIQDVIDRKYPPARLRMEHFYGPRLGRPLTDEERRRIHSIPDLARGQVAVVRQLASDDRMYAGMYLADVVKSATTDEREAFIDSVLRDGGPS